MKAIELAKAYDPKTFEDRIYKEWKDGGYFKPAGDKTKPSFTVVMPPPNVTGILHMGHALNNSLQDILVRYYRMTGRPTLWVPGTDHAGIATQHVVEKQLAQEGKRRQDLGREAFLERTWKVKEKHHDIIAKQLEKIGCSCDWSHERFTMDEGLSKAVRECFVTLYERGLIYKSNYLVNYCPHCGTALADDEVEHKEVDAKLYDVKYPYADGSGCITVATTRPETMFGDVAVAVHPDDERYKAVVGKMLHLPLTDRDIPIIADPFVDIGYGTGMVKITPAHDPHDYDCGKRHNLPQINVLNPDGTLNNNCPEKYRNLDPVSARKLVVADLKEAGWLVKETPLKHEVGHCYRCGTTVEPYLSEQWFVRMRTLADKALKAWETKDVIFYPKHWENTYIHWMSNIRDWCISRQLWWGHRIPVWYCKDCGEMIVSREDPSCCTKCGSRNIEQDTDVLDTWFSSWLWPFSTLGWPGKTDDFKNYFPTNALVSAYDIIFFWISRMVMASEEFIGKAPFRDIYVTGLVRDKQGRKMSKSLGNGIDPIEVVDKYGADAMKFTLCFLAAQGQDIGIDMDSFALGSRFANKIWNATRFILMNLEGKELKDVTTLKLTTMDKWIYNSLNECAAAVKAGIEGYRFNDAAQAVQEFFWNNYCDWYVEAAKQSLYSDDKEEQNRIVSILLDVLTESLKIMHPFLSFITEEIYSKLPNTDGKIINAAYPEFRNDRCYPKEAALVSSLQEAVRAARNSRISLSIPPEKKIRCAIRTDVDGELADFFEKEKHIMLASIGAKEIEIDRKHSLNVSGALPAACQGFEVFVYVGDVIDVEAEKKKIEAEIAKAEQLLKQTDAKLSNEKFVSNAAPAAVEKERAKKAEFEETIEKGRKHLELLSGF